MSAVLEIVAIMAVSIVIVNVVLWRTRSRLEPYQGRHRR